ncbi:MAG: hypothetical protein AB4058_22335 [Microcystaceae cyanobacterium]
MVAQQENKKAILLKFKDHLSLWELIYDQIIKNYQLPNILTNYQ